MEGVQFTILKNLKGPLSKAFTLEDGELRKTSAASLYDGIAETRTVDSLHGLAGIIDGLTSAEALTFGVCGFAKARVVTRKKSPKLEGLDVVCRDRKHFHWPEGRGILMFDIDQPRDGSAPLKAMELDALLGELQPWWKSVARMYRPSASAFICDAAGKDYTGASSLRCYSIIDIAKNAPFVGINVADAFWRAGRGRIEFSACGSMLVRCPVDMTVWQPERLDFAGPVVLGPGLIKRSFPPLFFEGSDIDSEAVLYAGIGEVSFSEWSRGSIDVRRAKEAHKPEEKRRKGIVIEERVKADVARGEDAEKSRSKWEDAILSDELRGSFMLEQLIRPGVTSMNQMRVMFAYFVQLVFAADPDFKAIPNGMPGLETRLPLLFDAMVSEGRLSLEKFVALTATEPAKIYGLHPKKGDIVIGSDADLVVWDQNRKVTIGANLMHDRAG